MKNSWHCELCSHHRKNLSDGIICNLTKRKPEFNNTCIKKSFSTHFKKRLREANVSYQYAIKDKYWDYAYSVLFLFLSLAVIALAVYSIFYIRDVFSINNSSTIGIKILIIPFIIFGIAMKLLHQAAGMFNNYRSNLKIAKFEKEKIDAVLSLYQISYKIDIEFPVNYHGPSDAKTNLEVFNLR